MNWYYELEEGTTVLGRNLGRYIVMPDCSPAQGGDMIFAVHDQALQVATRAWIENANGVQELYSDTAKGYKRWLEKPADLTEFFLVKLKASSLK